MTVPLRDSWIQRPRPRPQARLRLLMIPHAGGGASTFRAWADALPPEVEACPVQLPGRENRAAERPFEQTDALVQALGEALERWRDLPYAVFGHSSGAIAGFELARHARRQGVPGPVHLFASGRRAPHLPPRQPDVHALPDAEFIERLAGLGGIPREVLEHRELVELIVPLLRADLTLAETYVCRDEPPLSIGITALTGDQDGKAPVDDVREWARHTTGEFRLHVFPGDHFYLFPQREAVLRTLSHELHALLLRAPHRAPQLY